MNTETVLSSADEARLEELRAMRDQQRRDESLMAKLVHHDEQKRTAEEERSRAENAARRTAEAQRHAERLGALAKTADGVVESLRPFDAALQVWREERKRLADLVAIAAINGDALPSPETEGEFFGRLNEKRRKAGMTRGAWLFTNE